MGPIEQIQSAGESSGVVMVLSGLVRNSKFIKGPRTQQLLCDSPCHRVLELCTVGMKGTTISNALPCPMLRDAK